VLVSAEPVSVVLSEAGWFRAAKGHDIDATTLSYKSGDAFKFAARGKSNQPVVVLDSTGRTYTVAAHTLPSARGQGEPLTGRISPPSGATFEGLLMGSDRQAVLLASEAGYGFVTTLGDLEAKNRGGKAVLSLPAGSRVAQPAFVPEDDSFVVAASNDGRLLLFPLGELPRLSRGKGNKIIGITAAKVALREEFMIGIAVMTARQTLRVFSGKRYLNLNFAELEHYRGERGRRGNKLPRGFQKVDGIAVVAD
jgi:topoisomerase-4 subunit A